MSLHDWSKYVWLGTGRAEACGATVFDIRLPRALSPVFIRQALQASEGILGRPAAAMRGLVAARAAVFAAVLAIDGYRFSRVTRWPTGFLRAIISDRTPIF